MRRRSISTAGGTFTLTRVDSNNATNGIVLNDDTGSFTVTGTGAAGTGGTIQNITTRGASFINASNISLTNMNFTNASQNDGPTAPDGVVGGNSTRMAPFTCRPRPMSP